MKARRMRRGMALLVAMTLLALGPLHAQVFPGKPLKLIIPFAPGGPMDTVGRLLGREMEKTLGQPVVVDNQPGAGGTVAVRNATRQSADGHTMILVSPGPLVVSPVVDANLPYKVSDLAPVGQVYEANLPLSVRASLPVRNLREFVELARASPGKLNYAHTGAPGLSYLAMEMFKLAAGIDVVDVPFKGDGPILVELLAGRVDASTISYTAAAQHVAEGKVRMLATFGPRRASVMPNVPTVSESGWPEVVATGWVGLFVPAGTPAAAVQRLNAAMVGALAVPAVRERMMSLDVPPAPSSPEQFALFVKAEADKWARLLKALPLKATGN
ncbi:MAG: tripartite tricarboxylate transporter substrate binding protein [Burkholderiaceae bacterium]|nr:tripartite tricarboxylate transporter substrate binding protein [Burkholderiaceae bacterium]